MAGQSHRCVGRGGRGGCFGLFPGFRWRLRTRSRPLLSRRETRIALWICFFPHLDRTHVEAACWPPSWDLLTGTSVAPAELTSATSLAADTGCLFSQGVSPLVAPHPSPCVCLEHPCLCVLSLLLLARLGLLVCCAVP